MAAKTFKMILLATALMAPSLGQAQLFGGVKEVKPVAFQASAADAGKLTKPERLEVLRGIKSVLITQFTVEFVERSMGLTNRQKDGSVAVNYQVAGLDDATTQALVDKLYDQWAASLTAQGLTVTSPEAAAGLPAWERGISAIARPTPAAVDTPMGRNRVFAARATPFYFLDGEREAATSGAAKTATGLAGRLPFGGMATGLMGMGKGLKAGGARLGEMRLGQDTGAAIMRVRLVVGLRETDKPSRAFAAIRSDSAFVGEPRFAIEGKGSSVEVTSYAGKGGTARVSVPADLLFAQNLLDEHVALADTGLAKAGNVAARGMFLVGAVSSSFGGVGLGDLKQSHEVAATPDKLAYAAAAEENLSAVQKMFLEQLKPGW
jgi:hypothetical protein